MTTSASPSNGRHEEAIVKPATHYFATICSNNEKKKWSEFLQTLLIFKFHISSPTGFVGGCYKPVNICADDDDEKVLTDDKKVGKKC